MNPVYKRDMEHNYMILESPQKTQGNEYQIRMLLMNQVPGLLTCKIRIVDGVLYFYYEITSRQTLSRIFERKPMNKEDIRHLLMGIKRAINGVKEHLLDVNDMLLDPEYIYMEPETGEVSLCYLPFCKSNMKEDFGKLAEYILRNLDHEDKEAVIWGYEIYSGTIKENYNLESILQSIYRKEVHSKEKLEFYKKREEDQNQAEQRIALESYQNLEAQLDYNINTNEGEPTLQSLRKGLKVILRVILIVLTLSICAGAFWYSGLTALQSGGVLFLLIGIGIYFFHSKVLMSKKSKQQDIYDEYIEENYTEEAKDQSSTGQNSAGQKSFEQKHTRKICPKRHNDLKGMAAIEGSRVERNETKQEKFGGKQELHSEGLMYRKERDIQSRTNDEEKQSAAMTINHPKGIQDDECVIEYGATTVLNKASGRAYPLLVSIEPDGDTIPIQKDELTFGKLKHQVDILIPLPEISRLHARIQKLEDGYYITDLNSTNGTFINKNRMETNESRKLQDGDKIQMGSQGYFYRE